LSAEPWSRDDTLYYDAVTPYGFGGPFFMETCDTSAFWYDLNLWATTTGVISLFFRLSPFAADLKEHIDKVEVTGGNVIRSLTGGLEAIWEDYPRSLRKSIRHAEKIGLSVKFDETGESLGDFLSIYYRTMKRRNALEQYYFPEDFFRKIIENLPGQFVFSHAIYQGKVIASKLGLVSQRSLYNFLGGADDEFFKMNPNEFLTNFTFVWGIDRGKKNCVLGGGYNGYDGIFQYKKKYAPTGVVPFEVGKHIFDNQAYSDLCENRRQYAADNDRIWVADPSYFPVYRSKND
jgi:hypothetical protein